MPGYRRLRGQFKISTSKTAHLADTNKSRSIIVLVVKKMVLLGKCLIDQAYIEERNQVDQMDKV